MKLGMVGAGRMGANMARRLQRAGIDTVVYDVNPDALAPLAEEGFVTTSDAPAFVAELPTPRAIWMMIPAAYVKPTVGVLAALLDRDDTLVDGGNTWFREDLDRAAELAPYGIHYVDCGTSGGVHGLQRGYCLMIGGPDEAVQRLDPVFAALAPGIDAAPRSPSRTEATPSTAEQGYLHCGPSGAGHFVKMLHNGIEYGIMAAYAEGLNVLHNAGLGREDHVVDAETTPLRDPAAYQYDFDLAEVTELWRRGSVVGSWLLDLTADALYENPRLDDMAGRVSDSGEGRWSVQSAIDLGVPAPVMTAAVYNRFSSRDNDLYANKVLSAMRRAFGGHHEKKAADDK